MIKAIAVLPEDIRREMEQVYFDMFPETSRCVDDWEKVFAVVFSSKELEKQRNVLAALWRINKGGQSAVFLESILQNIDKDILVVENVPISNPRQKNVVFVAVCKNKIMCCGNKKAVCGYRIGDGEFDPTVLRNDVSEVYSIKNDKKYWGFCFFVCKRVVRNSKGEILYIEKLKLKKDFKKFVEYFILKIKPVHSVAIVFIEWVD
ncbi:MAG: hypothetical protein ACTTKB_04520 [Treponema sp.]